MKTIIKSFVLVVALAMPGCDWVEDEPQEPQEPTHSLSNATYAQCRAERCNRVWEPWGGGIGYNCSGCRGD